jgi:acyl carrier protein
MAATSSELEQFLKDFFKNEARFEGEFHLELRLIDDIGLDSIGFLVLADKLEEQFDIELETLQDHSFKRPETVGQMIQMIVNLSS